IMLFNLRFRPTKTLAPLKEGVWIQGDMALSKAEALALQNDIILFDDFYQSLGFSKAWKTRVLLLENNRFNTGPFTLPEPLKLGLWPFKSDYWLNLVVEPTNIDLRHIPSVLFHERAHLIISSH